MSNLQDTLLEEFRQIQGAIADSTEAWSVSGGRGATSRDTAPAGNIDALGDQTGRIEHGSTATPASQSGGAASGILNAYASGGGLISVGLEIARLFQQGPSAPPALTDYAMPESVGFIGSTGSAGALSNTDFDQTGRPRTYGIPGAPMGPSQTGQPAGSGQPVQITVQAMDAQSILDRSDDIAHAVNKAILALHPVADTISNL